jgi:hypothetical protein
VNGDVTYICGHVVHDPEAPQDAEWKAETYCPECSAWFKENTVIIRKTDNL